MADPLLWPIDMLPFQSVLFSRQTKSVSGGQSVNGSEQVVASSADRWRARVSIKIARYEQAFALRWLMAQSDGRAGTWLIPPCAGVPLLGTYPSGAARVTAIDPRARFANDDGTLSAFGDTSTLDSTLEAATVIGGAAMRDRSLGMQMRVNDPEPLPGQYFSIGQNLYVIASVSVIGEYAYSLGFRPGLRVAAPAGTAIEFTHPACLMRLATDETGDMDLDLLRFSAVTLDFVEAL